ncbi:MAG: restriction endonuclease [Chloroflexi bacterium]|nr:restriction endonuclease [Chloroflexota bacterium]
MKIWAAYYYQDIELSTVPRQQVMDQLVAEISQRYQLVSAELGVARESQIREVLRYFAGQEVSEKLFGRQGTRRLPTFHSVESCEENGVELDAVADNDERWVVEVKWRNEPATRKDLEALVDKARNLAGRRPTVLWFIARAGFRESALRFARQRDLAASSQQDVQALAEIVGLRLGK